MSSESRRTNTRRRNDFSNFIDGLLKHFEESSDKLIQINKISNDAVVEKRRLYDLMNVLVACGVCAKSDTHTYRWSGLASFATALKQIARSIESRAIREDIDVLFLLPESPAIGTLTTCFIALFVFLGLNTMNIHDAAIAMSQDEERSKPVLRRLYLVAYLMEHAGLLRHAQKIGDYLIAGDLEEVTMQAVAELVESGEFSADMIESHLSRIDRNFVRRMHALRREQFMAVRQMRTAAQVEDDVQYMAPSQVIDI